MEETHEPIVVEVWRGRCVESRHTVAACIVDERGKVIARYGDAETRTFWRSSAKPFQARPWIDGGVATHFGWGPEEIATMCASHVGAPVHVELVRHMLSDLGLDESHLLCDHALKARHNCSGNHTGILAGCVYYKWHLATYQDPGHPAEKAMLESVAEASGLSVADIDLGVDGCGIVTYCTPIRAAAQAFARLPNLNPPIANAMQQNPVLVEGEGELDTVVMQAFPGCISKSGAEGLGCASLGNGVGLSLKVLDGADRAVGPALVGLLKRHLGLSEVPEQAEKWLRPAVLNDSGIKVGQIAAVLPGE